MNLVENVFKKAYGEKTHLLKKTYVEGTHWNCLTEAIPMCTYNKYATENKEENYLEM